MREIETKGLLDEEFARWFNKSCESATSRPELDPAPREGPRVVPRDRVVVGNQPHPSSARVLARDTHARVSHALFSRSLEMQPTEFTRYSA